MGRHAYGERRGLGGLGRARVFEFEEKVINVAGHAESAASASIIPLDQDASEFVAGHVKLYTIEFLE